MPNEEKYAREINALIRENPQFGYYYDNINSILEKTNPAFTEMDVIEIDGIDYAILKEFEIKGTAYVHLVNVNDPLDFMFRKVLIEDGEEYLVGLDSDQEFDLVFAYDQKFLLQDLKRAQDMIDDNAQGN